MNRVVKLILDTTAVAAFTLGSEDVGETIREVVDEDAAFAVPALCLAEAGTAAKVDELAILDLLAAHSHCVVLPMPSWRALADGARVYGSLSRAAVADAARSHRWAYILTSEPDTYGGLPTIEITA